MHACSVARQDVLLTKKHVSLAVKPVFGVQYEVRKYLKFAVMLIVAYTE